MQKTFPKYGKGKKENSKKTMKKKREWTEDIKRNGWHSVLSNFAAALKQTRRKNRKQSSENNIYIFLVTLFQTVNLFSTYRYTLP